MSFFNKKILNVFFIETSLSYVVEFIVCHFSLGLFRKRTSLSASLKKAEITVEVSIILPLFISACLSVLFFAELFRLEVKVDEALFNCAKIYAQYGGLLGKREIESNILIDAGINGIGKYEAEKFVINELGENYLEKSILANGKNSFSFANSSISSEYIDLIVTYNVKFPVPFFNLPKIPIVQRCRYHAWSGKNKKEITEQENQEIVYVTPNGTVYHKSINCTYIKFQIEKISYSTVKDRRNSSGGKYYPCEKCLKNTSVSEKVFITKTGTRYHNSVTCSELKRTINEIKLSEAEKKYKPCNRCGN